MFQRILVPLDGSARAEQALPVAARFARAARGRVILLRVVNLTTQFISYPTADAEFVRAAIDADLDEASDYLERLASSRSLAGIATEIAAAVDLPADTILAMGENHQIDLIIMCSHGYTGFKHRVYGSVSENVAAHASVPVLVLHEGATGPFGPQPQASGEEMIRALVPLDGSALAEASLMPAARLIAAVAAPGKGAIHLLRVVGHDGDRYQGRIAEELLIREAREYLSLTTQRLQEELQASPLVAANLTLSWSLTLDVDPASGIVHVAEGGKEAKGAVSPGRYDLIAMATHGYGGLQRWIRGSVTESVLEATRIPMLAVHRQKVKGKRERSDELRDIAVETPV